MAKSSGGVGGGFQLASASVKIFADDKSLDADLRRVRNKVQAATSGLARSAGMGNVAGLFQLARLLGPAALGMYAVGKAVKESAAVAMQSERINAKLGAALELAGGAAGESVAKFDRFATTVQDIYGVSRDAAKGAATLGLNLGVTKDQIEGATQVAIGLSQAMGTDLNTAMHTLSKALEGNFMLLQRQFPQLAQLRTAQEKLAFVERLAAKGLAEKQAAMNGAAGATERMRLAASDLGRELGGFLLPALARATQDTADFFKAVTDGTEEHERSLLGLEQAILKVQQFWADFHSDATTSKKLQKEIDALEEAIEASMGRQVKAANDAANKTLHSQLHMLGAIKSAHQSMFGKLDHLWQDNEKMIRANEGAIRVVGDKNAAAAAGRAPLPPGQASANNPLERKGQGAPPAAPVASAAKGAPAGDRPMYPESEREHLQNAATRNMEMAGEFSDDRAYRYLAKMHELNERAKQYGPHEAGPNVMQKMAMDISEMLQKAFTGTADRPLRVKADDKAITDWLAKIFSALNTPRPGTFGP